VSLPRVDPDARRGPVGRALVAFGRSRAGRWYGINVAAKVDPWLARHTRGRVTATVTLPTATLTTRGARSGAVRVAPVLYFHDRDDVVLVASSFGRPRTPAWLHNLRAHPDACRLERRGRAQEFVAAEVPPGTEYERLYAMAVRLYPGYADYRERAGRHIPVMRLRPA
jgi:deazaflavin-dependent oxidoreductase (nitroreductase family)